jgi:hypothetical protein
MNIDLNCNKLGCPDQTLSRSGSKFSKYLDPDPDININIKMLLEVIFAKI